MSAVATMPSLNVKKGDLLSFTMFVSVDSVVGDQLKVRNVDTEDKLTISGVDVIRTGLSADSFNKTQYVPRTKVVSVLQHLSNTTPMTVKFTKKDGSPRVLRGKVLGTGEVNLGYINVVDLDLDPGEHRERKVDTRTVEYVIADNVKYVVR